VLGAEDVEEGVVLECERGLHDQAAVLSREQFVIELIAVFEGEPLDLQVPYLYHISGSKIAEGNLVVDMVRLSDQLMENTHLRYRLVLGIC
jgi:hypothetical protein